MPISHEILPDEPIVIFTITGTATLEDLREVFRRSAALIEARGPILRISDFTHAESDFPRAFAAIREASVGQPGSTTDPNVTSFMVGRTQWVKMAAEFLKQPQFGGLTLPIFASVNDALDAARVRLRAG